MYAVIETGGKQYRVEVGTELEVELLDGAAGDSIKLERILLDALQVEQIVEEGRQPARLCSNDLEVALRLLGGDFPVEHERREPEHARERCPQLVRDVAHQLALDLLALAKRPVSLFEISEGALE